MEANPIAVVTFFSKTICGYCKQFKGEIKDERTGAITIDPNSGWETLTSDLDLQRMGVVFNLYQFGPEEDPKTGKVLNYVLAAPYSDRGRINGVPHLEVSIPGDPTEFVPFNPSGLTSWKAEASVPLMKAWIIQTLQTEPFKSYAAAVRSGRAPAPTQAQQPRQATPSVQQAPPMENSSARVAQVQAQQRAYEQNARTEQGGSQHHHHHAHASHQHYHGEEDGPVRHARQGRQAQNQQRFRQPVEQHAAPTTFGMGTQQIKPVVTPASVPVSPARRNANPTPAPAPHTIEKPKPRFRPANADDE